MSMLPYIIKTWLIGIAIAAPVGPIGILCIKKTLEFGMKGALLVGLGAAIADSVYGVIAALGLTAISHTLINSSTHLKLIGGLFLFYLAYVELKSKPTKKETFITNTSQVKIVSEVFFLTISNPMTILSFFGIFASISMENSTTIDSLIMVVGIFLGSMTWWYLLGFSISKIKDKLPKLWIGRIKWASSFTLVTFGFIAILGGFRDFYTN